MLLLRGSVNGRTTDEKMLAQDQPTSTSAALNILEPRCGVEVNSVNYTGLVLQNDIRKQKVTA